VLEAAAYVSMAGGRVSARVRTAVYVSMAGRRCKGAEAAAYVSMAGGSMQECRHKEMFGHEQTPQFRLTLLTLLLQVAV
jgi:hypothetical protein